MTGKETLMKDALPYYNVGPLLYCPANNPTIVHSLTTDRFGTHYSLALCLEDTIGDTCVAQAEEMLLQTLHSLRCARAKSDFYLPDLYIRVRSAAQICSLTERMESAGELVKGFILPKFSPDNADGYLETILQVNSQSHCHYYMMPIMESPSLVSPSHRAAILSTLKDKLDTVSPLVLNIRVGGNDLCNVFGFRRRCGESIHQIHTIANIFADVIAVFGTDYIISGPVWEYYGGSGWDTGLRRELQEDRLCGFIGKTVIHPRQIPLVNEAFRVSRTDWEDAAAILNWDQNSPFFVAGSPGGERMNECKTHANWAARTLLLAQAYGIE